MSPRVDFAYAQARIQARYGARPSEADWQQLEGVADFALCLERARGTPLAPWLAEMGPVTPVHELEARLRAALRALIEELAGWLPQPWVAAARWVALLPGLPIAQQLARGGEAPAWMRRDDSLAPWQGSGAQLGLPGGPGAADAPLPPWLPDAWLDRWRGLWPAMGRAERAGLERLVQLLRAHLRGFAQLPPEQAWEARRALQQRLRWLFRAAAFGPAAPFAYLALVALDLERLRAALVARALYPPRGGLP